MAINCGTRVFVSRGQPDEFDGIAMQVNLPYCLSIFPPNSGDEMVVFAGVEAYATVLATAPSDWCAVPADRGIREDTYATVEVFIDFTPLSSQKTYLCQGK